MVAALATVDVAGVDAAGWAADAGEGAGSFGPVTCGTKIEALAMALFGVPLADTEPGGMVTPRTDEGAAGGDLDALACAAVLAGSGAAAASAGTESALVEENATLRMATR